jgi:hypothetical protein
MPVAVATLIVVMIIARQMMLIARCNPIRRLTLNEIALAMMRAYQTRTRALLIQHKRQDRKRCPQRLNMHPPLHRVHLKHPPVSSISAGFVMMRNHDVTPAVSHASQMQCIWNASVICAYRAIPPRHAAHSHHQRLRQPRRENHHAWPILKVRDRDAVAMTAGVVGMIAIDS